MFHWQVHLMDGEIVDVHAGSLRYETSPQGTTTLRFYKEGDAGGGIWHFFAGGTWLYYERLS